MIFTDADKYSYNKKIKSIITNDNEIFCDALILATGYSSDIYNILYKNKITLMPKGFAIGLRMEHPQKWINTIQYGEKKLDIIEKIAGPAEYYFKYNPENYLSSKAKNYEINKKNILHTAKKINAEFFDFNFSLRPVYSFCMCPGGYIIPAMEKKNLLVTNGMSYHNRDNEFGNSALVVSINALDYYKNSPLDGIKFRAEIEKSFFDVKKNFIAPAQKIIDFLRNSRSSSIKSSYKPGIIETELKKLLPDYIYKNIIIASLYFESIMPGFIENGVFVGPETRTSTPVRIERNLETGMIKDVYGVFAVGEGSGYAGGIISAAVDGIKAAMKFSVLR